MQYGFVIDQDACIGCHACTVACKAENDVPVGGFRTNVKYVEVGKFPQVKRSFLVQRCNQCTDAPCVTICPVNALTKRKDGIVDIDRDACIGCRACMQACPYDALYLNDDLGAVEKCHFCAHRIEKGLEPACVTVCPVGAIIPGDFDDPESRVSLIKRAQLLTSRRPEQGTGPNVLYIGASEASLNPGMAEKPDQYMWSQRRNLRPEPWPTEVGTQPDAMEVLNADHKIEWGWPVALYLVTKGIAAGAAMIAPFFGLFDVAVPWWAPEAIALFFTLVTVFLLIEDLKKPMHFYKLFTRPNWDSWLVKGGIVLTVFGGLSAVILLIGLIRPLGLMGLIEPLRWANAAVAVLVAGYTAFLFKQCKGRDLWEADGLFWHLIAQSVTAGAACYALAGIAPLLNLALVFCGAACLGLLHLVPAKPVDQTDNFLQARGFMHETRLLGIRVQQHTYAFIFGCASIGIILVKAIYDSEALTMAQSVPVAILAFIVLSLLFLYESAYIRAGQLPPLS